MPAIASENLASLIAAEDGDAAWERIIADLRPRPKLEAFMKTAMTEVSSEPLDDHLLPDLPQFNRTGCGGGGW